MAGLFFIFTRSRTNIIVAKPSQLSFVASNYLVAQDLRTSTNRNAETTAILVVSSASSPLEDKIKNLKDEDQVHWSIIKDILKSKNDNDPRIDQSLKNLSPALHAVLFEKYQSISAEDFSARGMIVYLIARDLKTSEDVEFLKKVYQESPCLSLADCKSVGADDAHHSSMNQTTLVLAQLEGLYVIEKQLQDQRYLFNNPTYRSGVVQILVQAESYPVAVVREKAQSIRLTYEL